VSVTPKRYWLPLDSAAESMTDTDDLRSQQYYHGTRADLKPGDLIEPGRSSNFGTQNKSAYVYLTSSLDTAAWGAELAAGEGTCRIYTVKPTGRILADPNLTREGANPAESYRSREPLRVTGEYTDWQGHSVELIDAMKDRIARLGLKPMDE
jgi:hypothetical protein